jgi:hypothetical protein
VILLAAILLTALAASGLLLLKWRLAAIRLGVPQPAHTAVVEKRVMVHITLTGHSNSGLVGGEGSPARTRLSAPIP